MFNEKVSVIIPIYNVDQYLEKCLNSVLEQTYQLLEIILINDGSTDLSGSICEIYKEKDKRLIVIHKENGGLSSARNAGIEISTGEYIAFIDSDDFIHPEMIETLVRNATSFDADIAVCDFLKFKEGDDVSLFEDSGTGEVKIYNNLDALNQLPRQFLFKNDYNV
jgi:glycosyltransferase involved in cell wall biosynthesis